MQGYVHAARGSDPVEDGADEAVNRGYEAGYKAGKEDRDGEA